MKKIAFILALVAIVSCRPERRGELGPNPDLSTGHLGTWEVTGLSIFDYKWPLGDEMDVTDELPFFGNGENFVIKFNEDRSYEILNAWDITPLDFGTGGAWMYVGNQEFPSKMKITTNTGKTIDIKLRSMVRDYDPTWSLEIESARCGGDLTMGYILKLTRK